MGQVEGKVALVTGASSGIGAATARLLAREGAAVVLTDVQAKMGEGVAESINSDGGRALFVRQDVTQEGDWEQTLAAVTAQFGACNVLVNNAGGRSARTPLEDTSLEEWRRLMAVNMDGVFLGVKHGIRAMKSQGGAIVNISSIYGLVGAALTGAYCASKGAVRLLTKTAAVECAQLGYKIRVNSVHPGFIVTAMTDSAAEEIGREAMLERFSNIIPMKNMGMPEDIAAGILYLVSDAAKYVTGTELVIDGGMVSQ